MCPIAALAFYLHYVHDVVGIEEKYGIDWTVNKSWRPVRQTFYNDFTHHHPHRFGSSMDQMQPCSTTKLRFKISLFSRTRGLGLRVGSRSILQGTCLDINRKGWGMYTKKVWKYRILTLSISDRVEAEQTSKLGWSRDTYQNTYAPALPKKVCDCIPLTDVY